MKGLMIAVFVILAAGILIAGTSPKQATPPPQTEKPWFDMQNCAFCKSLMAEPGLMQHMLKWEHFKTADGLINITVVDKDYTDAYKKAQANMDAVTARLEKGENLPLCGSCTMFGEILKEGAKYEKFQSDNIFVSSLTCDKPEVIAKIHTWVDSTQAEMAKMQKQEKPKEAEPKTE